MKLFKSNKKLNKNAGEEPKKVIVKHTLRLELDDFEKETLKYLSIIAVAFMIAIPIIAMIIDEYNIYESAIRNLVAIPIIYVIILVLFIPLKRWLER